MNDRDHQKLISEVHFNRALIWMVMAFVIGPDNKYIMAVDILACAYNVWKSYIEWPD